MSIPSGYKTVAQITVRLDVSITRVQPEFRAPSEALRRCWHVIHLPLASFW